MSEPANWLCVKMGAASDPEHAKACVFCLTTRLAEAQEKERFAREEANLDNMKARDQHARAVAAETRLAEVERERDEKNSRIAALEKALQPFARFADQWDAKPFRGMDDRLYGIHIGTEWAAELTLTDCRAAKSALR